MATVQVLLRKVLDGVHTCLGTHSHGARVRDDKNGDVEKVEGLRRGGLDPEEIARGWNFSDDDISEGWSTDTLVYRGEGEFYQTCTKAGSTPLSQRRVGRRAGVSSKAAGASLLKSNPTMRMKKASEGGH